jgi:hypothetical protein
MKTGLLNPLATGRNEMLGNCAHIAEASISNTIASIIK